MALKDIKKQLLDVLGLGGAPFSNDDFVSLQSNAKTTGTSFLEFLKSKALEMEHFNGGLLDETCASGVMVVPPIVDTSDLSNVAVSDFYFYVNGELLKSVGGTFDLTAGKVLFFGRGADLVSDRTYFDGVDKPFNFETSVSVFNGTYDDINKYTFDNSMDLSKDHVSIRVVGSTAVFDQSPENLLGVNSNRAFTESVDADLQQFKTELAKSTGWIPLEIISGNVTEVNTLSIKKNKIGTVFLRGAFSISGGNSSELALRIPLQFGGYNMVLPSTGVGKNLETDLTTYETDGSIVIQGQDIYCARKSGDTLYYYLDGVVLEPSVSD